MKRTLLAAALLAMPITFAQTAQAEIMVGLTDDFEGGTVLGWVMGPPANPQPQNIADGGPNGAGDAFLRVDSLGGNGPSSRLILFNTDQWAGDYLAAGVGEISVAFNNLGATQLAMRIAVESGDTWFASSDPLLLPAGSGWTQAVFSLAEADVTRVQGSASYADALSNVTELRILSAAGTPNFRGDAIIASVGVDNITALPEPGAAVVLTGVLMLLGRRRACS